MMIRHISILTGSIALLVTFTGGADLPIVPKPKIAERGKGNFTLSGRQVTLRVSAKNQSAHDAALEGLDRAIRDYANTEPVRITAGAPEIWLGITSEDKEFENHCRSKRILPEDRIGEEGYILRVARREITIAGASPAGLFYGVQSLIQLLRGAEKPGILPAVIVVDWPDVQYRAVMDDISRGPIPTMAFFKEQIRRCAELKLNMLSHYVENVVITQSHPDLAMPGGGLTLDEWRELRDYSARYHVDLLGGFQSFGHFNSILSYPQYNHLGESGRMLSPVQEESYRLLADIYKEYIPIFKTPWFNVHSDETWDLGRAESKALVDSLGVGAAYAMHINRLDSLVKKYGKRTMLWADIALAHPEALSLLPRDAVLMAWEYSDLDSYEHLLAPLAKTGQEIFISPGVLNSNRIMPDYRQTRGNIRGFIREGVRYGIKGVLNTVWDDGGMALFSKDWYGVAYAAEVCWNVESGDQSDFENRFDRAFYGDRRKTLARVINQLNNLTDLNPTQRMNEQVFWDQLMPPRGSALRMNLHGWADVLEVCTQVDKVIQSSAPPIRIGDLDYFQFTADQYRYMARARMNLLSAANKYSQACAEQLTDREAVRQALVEVLGLVGETTGMLRELRHRYAQLWLRENRSYALDHVLESFDQRIEDLDDAELRIQVAIGDFDKGHALPPPTTVRLNIKQVDSYYFQDWLICGPFPYDRKRDDNPDYLIEMGGVASARPTVYSITEMDDGTEVPWKKVHSVEFGVVDLAKLYKNNRHVVAYAYATIESKRPREVRITLGSNDGIEVFVNGLLVHRNHMMRSLTLDEDELLIPVKAGKNHVMLQIDQGNGDWGFSFQLPDFKIKNNKHKYYIVE
ncbi:MAG: beta-N-acetylhexosaminidase [Fidelibacterota bacterium]|nr:MAG: beta-N-acetylhexosaminidase [Candidatus Neomarinimicrobiota bacterium]